jgi:hypothetical protein
MDPPALSTLAMMVTVSTPSHFSIASAMSVPTAVSNAMENQDPDQNGECQLLGPFSLVVQAALGSLALLSLVYKRSRERPQRPVKIWAFDVSKQVFGSAMLHLANLLMSMFSAGHFEITRKYQPNPCSFYLLNLGIDVSIISPMIAARSSTDLTDDAWNPDSGAHSSYRQPPCLIHSSRQSS